MAFYTIGDVAERCGINPVTLRAWQRRYGLLKPQRSEGGHRQFDEDDIMRIEEIKRWIKSGVPVSKVKAIIDKQTVIPSDGWAAIQEEMMSILRYVRPGRLRDRLAILADERPADAIIDNLLLPVRHRLNQEQNTARVMASLLDGVLTEYAVQGIAQSRNKPGNEALLLSWGNDDRTLLWLEGWRLSQRGWHIDVLPEPLEVLRPEVFPGQHLFLWAGKALNRKQQEQLSHWQAQGFMVSLHS